jgi:hypothetical protein
MRVDRQGDQIVISLRDDADAAFRAPSAPAGATVSNAPAIVDGLVLSGDVIVMVVNVAGGHDGPRVRVAGGDEAAWGPAAARSTTGPPDALSLAAHGCEDPAAGGHVVALERSRVRRMLLVGAAAVALLGGVLAVGHHRPAVARPAALAFELPTTVPTTVPTTRSVNGCAARPPGAAVACLPADVFSIIALPACC